MSTRRPKGRAAGGPGVGRAIEILRADVVRTMKLLGCASIADLDESYLDVPAHLRRVERHEQMVR